ncbi:MAG: hypothetical protein RLZZ501_415 [Pseudomonadota bacterium]
MSLPAGLRDREVVVARLGGADDDPLPEGLRVRGRLDLERWWGGGCRGAPVVIVTPPAGGIRLRHWLRLALRGRLTAWHCTAGKVRRASAWDNLSPRADIAFRLVRRLVKRMISDLSPDRQVRAVVLLQRIEGWLIRRLARRQPPPGNSLLPGAAFAAGGVIEAIGSLSAGGAERQAVYTAAGIAARWPSGVTILCLYFNENEESRFYQPLVGPQVALAQARDEAAFPPPDERLAAIRVFLAQYPPDIRTATYRFVLEFLDRRPAVVHAWLDYTAVTAGLAALLVGVPRIVIGGRNMAPDNFLLYRACMDDIFGLLLGCDRVRFVNNSQAGARDYGRWLGQKPERFTVLYNGIDDRLIQRADPATAARFRQAVGIPAGARVVGGVFRLAQEKRPLLWIETMDAVARHCPDLHFLLLGSGPLAEACRRRAERRGWAERLHMPGALREVATALSVMDVVVATSVHEGNPNVLIEAGLLGLPIISTDAGGVRETLLPDQTGRIVAPTPAALAAAIRQVLDDDVFRAQAARLAPAFVRQRFGMERMIDETLAVYGAPAGDVRTGAF